MSDIRYKLTEIGYIPASGDNCAIATRTLPAGTHILHHEDTFTLNATVLVGHRFAIRHISTGERLLSWERPFGVATTDILPGHTVCNPATLAELNSRQLNFSLPPGPNFEDLIEPVAVDPDTFTPATPLTLHADVNTFMGYRRPGHRGVGTRNTIILLATTARTAGFVRQLEARLAGVAKAHPNIDGIVAIAHTEGDTPSPNNRHLLLRTLAGWITHPNVGAALIVDYGFEAVNNQTVRKFMRDHGYPLADVLHHFLSLESDFASGLEEAETIVREWLETVNNQARTEQPISELKLALQCGGSDAFSGVSGNPLAAWVARELLQYGGGANLAETDELIGAEPYILQSVCSYETAVRFLTVINRFKAWAAQHGVSPEGNPSGGNRFRGLYNIALKSLGAATKKAAQVPLDHVIDYSQPMREPGFYFMDSPGNDLESIAGQVAAGCNLIFFVTGNGSITNFPFVPTIKIVTTSERFALLQGDMDVNAGDLLDGKPLPEVGRYLFDLMLKTASGRLSVGEQAGHAQVQIWRNWQQAKKPAPGLPADDAPPLPGKPLTIPTMQAEPIPPFQAYLTPQGMASEQVALILPTSLCSGQIARMAAAQFNRMEFGRDRGISRFVALAHTEGCGQSPNTAALYDRIMLGYLNHPQVRHCLLLEHGCEKTHNDYLRQRIIAAGQSLSRYGWASIQLDGGINHVMAKMETWFGQRFADSTPPERQLIDPARLYIGVMASGEHSEAAAREAAAFVTAVVQAGGTVITPQQFGLLSHAWPAEEAQEPTLAFGQPASAAGLHLMATPATNWSETVTGLGAAGVSLIIGWIGDHPRPGHPLLPVVQVSDDSAVIARYGADLDLQLPGSVDSLIRLIADVYAGKYTPQATRRGNHHFQITRGLGGISL